jgi:hypothetical protein
MTQKTFERVRRIELELKVAPSHYEPGLPPERRDGRDSPDRDATADPRAGRTGNTEEHEAVRL